MSVRGNSLMENGRVRHSLLRGTRPCACLPPQRFPQRLTGRCRAAPRRGASCVARCCPEGRTQAPGPCPPEASLERGGHLSRVLTTPNRGLCPTTMPPAVTLLRCGWVGRERSSAARRRRVRRGPRRLGREGQRARAAWGCRVAKVPLLSESRLDPKEKTFYAHV